MSNERKGLVFVPKTNELYSPEVAADIKTRANKVFDIICSELSIEEKELSFEITSYRPTKASIIKKIENVASENFQSVRVIYSGIKLEDEQVKEKFGKNELFVAINETSEGSRVYKIFGANGCRIAVAESRGRRLIEDIFIDIFIGRYFIRQPILKEFLERHSLVGLFNEKTKFFSKNKAHGWLNSISSDAGYAPLSSLNTCSDENVKERALATLKMWENFIKSLSVQYTTNTASISDKLVKLPKTETDLISSFKRIKIIGRQLPLKKIKKHLEELGLGEYRMLILRRSSKIRKSPKLANKIKSVFGPRAKINSFRIYNLEQFSSERKIISELLNNGHITGINFEITKIIR